MLQFTVSHPHWNWIWFSEGTCFPSSQWGIFFFFLLLCICLQATLSNALCPHCSGLVDLVARERRRPKQLQGEARWRESVFKYSHAHYYHTSGALKLANGRRIVGKACPWAMLRNCCLRLKSSLKWSWTKMTCLFLTGPLMIHTECENIIRGLSLSVHNELKCWKKGSPTLHCTVPSRDNEGACEPWAVS